jgi:hypothetical protein
MDTSTSPSTPPLVHRNQSIELLMNWKNSGPSTKSDGEINRLVDEVLLNPHFNLEDLQGFRAARENRQSDKADENSPFLDSFQTATVEIEVPSGSKEVPPAKFSIPGLRYRKIPAVIQAMFASPLASKFHLSPFKLFHKAPGGEEERVFCEVYDTDAYIEENDKIQRAPVPPDDPDCKREKAVAALMLWSDATHLANFGTAKLWPIYMFLGNLSKYVRSLPNSGACQHIAYIPSLPDSFQDFAAKFHKKWGTQKKDIITHCRRELMHAVWKILLDDEFIHVYKYGMVIRCTDGIERRIYPRIFTYSADYPEKWVCSANLLYTHSYDFASTECYLQLYEIRALLPVRGVLLQNPKWTRQVQNGIVNSVRRTFVNTYSTMFARLGMLYTEERLLSVVL